MFFKAPDKVGRIVKSGFITNLLNRIFIGLQQLNRFVEFDYPDVFDG